MCATVQRQCSVDVSICAATERFQVAQTVRRQGGIDQQCLDMFDDRESRAAASSAINHGGQAGSATHGGGESPVKYTRQPAAGEQLG